MTDRVSIDLTKQEIEAWKQRIEVIRRDLDMLDKHRKELWDERCALQRKVMAVEFLTQQDSRQYGSILGMAGP